MSKNFKRGNPQGGVTAALPVPVGTQAGWIVPIGDQGLTGYTLTPRATAETVADGTSNPGLAAGEASVRITRDFTAEFHMEDAGDAGDAVYTDGAGEFTFAADDIFVGYALTAANDSIAEVFVTFADASGS